MARRQGAKAADSYIRAARIRIGRLDGAAEQVNLAQFRAQRYTNDMVDVLAGMAMDFNTPPSLRRACAMDVVTLAYGVPKLWAHDGQTIDPKALLPDGTSVEDGASQAEQESVFYLQMSELVGKRVPPELWPEEVKRFAGDTLALYSEEGQVPEKIEN